MARTARSGISFCKAVQSRRRCSVWLIAAIIVAVAGLPSAYATDYSWTSSGGDFSDYLNWKPTGGPPGSDDTAIFDMSNSGDVLMLQSLTVNKMLKVKEGAVDLVLRAPAAPCDESATYQLTGSGAFGAIIGITSGVPATLRVRVGPGSCEPAGYISAEGMLYIGQITGSSGRLELGESSGPAIHWDNGGWSAWIGASGAGELKLNTAGYLSNGPAILGVDSGASGEADIYGHWTNAGTLTVGREGDGMLRNYWDVTTSSNAYIAAKAGSTGEIYMLHADADWGIGASLYVGGDDEGDGGTGLLQIDNGLVDVGAVTYVYDNGTINVDGGDFDGYPVFVRSGGEIACTGLGSFNATALTVNSNGLFSVSNGNCNLDAVQSTGAITVNGGALTVAGQITLYPGSVTSLFDGTISTETLSSNGDNWIWTGGSLFLTNSDLSIESSGALGDNLAISADKILDLSGALKVGPNTNGVLTTTGGGRIHCNLAVVGSTSTGSTPSIATVSGMDSQWELDYDLKVRGLTSAGLTISQQAAVACRAFYIADEYNSSGEVTVTDVDTNLECRGSLHVGGDGNVARGTGTLEVDDGAVLDVAGILKVWEGSFANIDGGIVDPTSLVVAGSYSATEPSVLDLAGGMLDINTGGMLDADLYGDASTLVALEHEGSSWSTFGSLQIGAADAGDGHIGSLMLESDTTVSVEDNVTVLDVAAFTLGGGTLNASTIDMLDQDFADQGTINGDYYTTGSVTATGNLSIGDVDSLLGVWIGGALNVGAHAVAVRKKGFFTIGNSTGINGGALTVPNGATLPTGATLAAYGTIDGRIAALTGSLIWATGTLTMGDATSPAGFYSDGELFVDDHDVTLTDLNAAVLGSLTWIGFDHDPGQLNAANGLLVDFGANIIGYGQVVTPDDPTTPLINNGAILGDGPGEQIELTGYVKGVGTMDYVTITGTDAPGFSPATVYRGAMVYNGTLEIELGGYAAFDKVVHSGVATLGGELRVELINGFTPVGGDSFTFLTAQTVTGEFDTETLPALSGGLSWEVEYLAAAVNLNVVADCPGDLDGDGDVDAADLDIFVDCSSGPDIPYTGDCAEADFDDDNDVDSGDYGLFQRCISGEDNPADPNCAD